MSSQRTPGRLWISFVLGAVAGFAIAAVGVATGKIYHRDDVVLGFFPKPAP